jgi:hypothetical protein
MSKGVYRGVRRASGFQGQRTEMAFSWKDAPDLMDALAKAQNAPCNSNIDIMTFAGFCNSRDELEAHLCYYETRAQNRGEG